MISMARTFGAPLTVPAGKVARRTSTALRPLGERAGDLAREMHHMGVTLERHQFIHLLGSELDHPPDVVAGKVDEHHVLGALLRMFQQLGAQAAIVLLARPAKPCTGDRADDHHDRRAPAPSARATTPRAWLPDGARRTCTATGSPAAARGTRRTDRPGRRDRIAARAPPGRCRRRGCAHAPLRPRRGTGSPGSVERTAGRSTSSSAGGGDGEYGNGWASSSTRSCKPRRGTVVRVVDVGLVREEHVLDQRQTLAEVVERRDVTRERQHGVGQPEIVGRDIGKSLDLAHDVVAEIPDDAAVERWKLRDARRAVEFEQRFEGGERALVARHGVGQAGRPLRRCGREPRACTPGRARGTRSDPTARRVRPTRAGSPADRRHPAPTSFTNAETGVSRSARTSRHTGTTVWSRANARKSSRASDGRGRASSPR